MARQKGTYSLSSNIELSAAAPLDARYIVEDVEALTDANSFPYSYIGMPVYLRSAQKMYTLRYADTTDINSWAEVGTGKDGKDGAPVEIDSVTKEGRQNIITFVWHDSLGADYTQDLIVLDGLQGATGATGPAGPQGPQGQSFELHSQYDSYEDLIEAHPTGEEGEAYFVESETEGNPPDVYVWLSDDQIWFNQGPITGMKGDTGATGPAGFAPQVTIAERTDSTYKLRITTSTGEFVTPNLKGADGNLAPISSVDPSSTSPVQSQAIATALDAKQDKTLSSSMSIGGTTATTVEAALTALNNKTVDVDNALSDNSQNPVENRVVKAAIDAKQAAALPNGGLGITQYGTGDLLSATTVEEALTILSSNNNFIQNPMQLMGRVNTIADLPTGNNAKIGMVYYVGTAQATTKVAYICYTDKSWMMLGGSADTLTEITAQQVDALWAE